MMLFTTLIVTETMLWIRLIIPMMTGSTMGSSVCTMPTTTFTAFTSVVPTNDTTDASSGISAGSACVVIKLKTSRISGFR